MQTIFTDAKSQDLYSLFKKEAQQLSDEAHYREAATQILGDLEHLFRIETASTFLFALFEHLLIEWACCKLQFPHLNVFTIQLLGKDDPNQGDPEIYIDRWRSYISSYTSVSSLSVAASTICRSVATGDAYQWLNGAQDQAPVPSKV